MSVELPPALLAQLDQEVATLETCVNQLVATADAMLDGMDRAQAMATLVLGLMAASNKDKSAAIAATAIVCLAEARRQ